MKEFFIIGGEDSAENVKFTLIDNDPYNVRIKLSLRYEWVCEMEAEEISLRDLLNKLEVKGYYKGLEVN